MKDYPKGELTIIEIPDMDLSLLQEQYRDLIRISEYLDKRGPRKFSGWVETIEGLLNLCEFIFDEYPPESVEETDG